MNMAPSTSSTPSPNPSHTTNGGGGSGPPSAGANGPTSSNSSLNAGQQQQGSAGNNDGPVSSERIACWITELLSSGTRENALMELSRKREKVADLAVLLWHSFGSVAVLLHEVM